MFEGVKKKAKEAKEWVSDHPTEVAEFVVGFGAGCLCMVTGYCIGRMRNPKIEMKYICDTDGKLLSGAVVNLTKQPLKVQLTNEDSSLPQFDEKVIPHGIEYGGITETAVNTFDLK
jgi:hypothetical protein